MKASLPLLAILLAGCDWSAQSSNPFYTEDIRQPAPQLLGEWLAGNSAVLIFTGDRTMSVRSYQEDGPRDISVVPFAINGRTFLDFHEPPNHTLYALRGTGRQLTLSSLSGTWLTNNLTGIPAPDANKLFHATSAQWVAFLRAHDTNEAIYGPSIDLVRSPNANFIPARRKQP